jgi:hypothetical protein
MVVSGRQIGVDDQAGPVFHVSVVEEGEPGPTLLRPAL